MSSEGRKQKKNREEEKQNKKKEKINKKTWPKFLKLWHTIPYAVGMWYVRCVAVATLLCGVGWSWGGEGEQGLWLCGEEKPQWRIFLVKL